GWASGCSDGGASRVRRAWRNNVRASTKTALDRASRTTARHQEARMKRLVVGALGSLLVATITTSAAVTDPVKIDSGLVSGAPGTNAGVRSYKGIPFAAAPTGENR